MKLYECISKDDFLKEIIKNETRPEEEILKTLVKNKYENFVLLEKYLKSKPESFFSEELKDILIKKGHTQIHFHLLERANENKGFLKKSQVEDIWKNSKSQEVQIMVDLLLWSEYV